MASGSGARPAGAAASAARPTWWVEIADDLANLGIAHVAVIEDSGAWRPVVYHVGEAIYTGSGPVDCATIPWMLAARPDEASAWAATEWFLRGLAAVRQQVAVEFPWAASYKTDDPHALWGAVVAAWCAFTGQVAAAEELVNDGEG